MLMQWKALNFSIEVFPPDAHRRHSPAQLAKQLILKRISRHLMITTPSSVSVIAQQKAGNVITEQTQACG